MKGFIEVKTLSGIELINVNAIQLVSDSKSRYSRTEYETIYGTRIYLDGFEESKEIAETYEEVKQKIEEAMR